MPSIDKAQLKIEVIKETRDGLENQKRNIEQTLYASQGAKVALDGLGQRAHSFVNNLDKLLEDGELDEKLYPTVKQYCSAMLGMVVNASRSADAGIADKKGRLAAVQDSIELTDRMIRAEEGKIELKKRQQQEAVDKMLQEVSEKKDENLVDTEERPVKAATMCAACGLRAPRDGGEECSRCHRYISRWGKLPGDDLISKWKEKDGIQDS